jgi:6-phosphogluconolactonase
MAPTIKIFPSVEKLTDYFVGRISDQLRCKKPGQYFSMALSGGSTPKAIFKIIAEKYNNKIDWSKVLIFWSDERCVPPTDKESNYLMTYENLFNHLYFPELKFRRIKGENIPADEANRYDEIVDKMLLHVHGIPQFDLIMLGLGEDGHTASIFPHNIDLFKSDKLFDISEHPVTKQIRITATGKLINNAKEVCFIVTGSGKSEIVAQILKKKEGWKELPASQVNPVDGQVIWLLDEAAGAEVADMNEEG